MRNKISIKTKGKYGAKNDIQRHSLPHPVEDTKHGRLVPRPRSFWFGTRKNTPGESESRLGGWADQIPTAVDRLDANPQRNSWRNSARSVTSDGSTSTLHDSGSQPSCSRSSDRFSLRSDGSSLSVLTRFSSSTSSTALTTAPPSRRSSRGSMLQREKRFSSLKCELHLYSWYASSSFLLH